MGTHVRTSFGSLVAVLVAAVVLALLLA